MNDYKVGDRVLFKQTVIDTGLAWDVGTIYKKEYQGNTMVMVYHIKWESNGISNTCRRYIVALMPMIDDSDIDEMVSL